MAMLACLGLGYCAERYVSDFGGRFTHIIGTSRTDGRAAALGARDFDGRKVEMLVFDGATASRTLIDLIEHANALLISAAPDEHGDPILEPLHEALAAAPRLNSVVLLSTIGVYGDRGGDWVDETATLDPNERAHPRLAAERAWRAFGQPRRIPVAALRLGGIYGPGQNALVNVRAGRARNIDKPNQVFNRIHVADIAQAIDAAFAHRADGIFNVVDDAPSPPGEPIAFAAELLGLPAPPVVPFTEAVKTMSPMAASFYAENRRVRNDKLKRELGVRLKYPTYREGLRALLTDVR
ncbi:MAG TPA: NAD-dependent epimerase/dehydratase family protein [Xanthobacteraceae bacterium]